MTELLTTIFVLTFVVCFILTFWRGKMFYQAMPGENIYPVSGWSARILSAFCILFLVTSLYFWIPENNLIANSLIYSNLVAFLVAVPLGIIIFLRMLKFNFIKYNALFDRYRKIINGIFIIALIVIIIFSII